MRNALKEVRQRNRRREELGAAPVAAHQSQRPSQFVLSSCHSWVLLQVLKHARASARGRGCLRIFSHIITPHSWSGRGAWQETGVVADEFDACGSGAFFWRVGKGDRSCGQLSGWQLGLDVRQHRASVFQRFAALQTSDPAKIQRVSSVRESLKVFWQDLTATLQHFPVLKWKEHPIACTCILKRKVHAGCTCTEVNHWGESQR